MGRKRKKDAEPETTWTNWAGDQTCTPQRIVHPRTREGLVAAVGAAVDDGHQIKASAGGHSFSDIALTDGVMLRVDALNHILDIDQSSGLVKIEAGATLGDLSRRLDRHDRAFENLGDIDHQSLAGALATATHGTGLRYGNLATQVEAVETVLADGTIREFSASDDANSFRAVRVGLGALGVTYSVTLRTVPAYSIHRVDRSAPLEETLDSLPRLAEDNDHFEFFVFPHTDTALLRESNRTDAAATPPNPAKRYLNDVVIENWALGAIAAIGRVAPATIPRLSRRITSLAGRTSRLDQSFRVFASERRVRFTEMEYAIPRAAASEVVRRVLELASRPELAVGMPIEVRFVAADDALLSPAHERDSCYIAVHMFRGLDWGPYFQGVETIMGEHDGRPHWGKRHGQTASTLASRYPCWSEFVAVRDQLDPDRAFANDFTARVLG